MVKTEKKSKSLIYPYHLDIIGKSHVPLSLDSRYLEYRKKWEINPKEKIVSEFPLHLDIEITSDCNLMCSHCFRHSRRSGIGDMDFELFKKVIDEGEKYELCAMDPGWMGESFLHPQVIEMINYAKSKNLLDVMIHTNGTLIDEEISERILESGLDTIIFSVDAVTEETYNRVKYGSDFREVNENIQYLIDLKETRGAQKPNIVVQMIDQKQSHEELMGFIHYWRARADTVRIAIYQSPDGKPYDKRRVQNSPETIFPCPQLWQRLVVAWDGTIYPCSGDNACREPLGSIHENSIHEIWHGERLNYLREKHKKYEADDIEACLHCDINKVPEFVNHYNGGEKNER